MLIFHFCFLAVATDITLRVQHYVLMLIKHFNQLAWFGRSLFHDDKIESEIVAVGGAGGGQDRCVSETATGMQTAAQ